MASMQAERKDVHAENEARSAGDDIVKVREECEQEQKNNRSIAQSVIGAVKSTFGSMTETVTEKTSDTRETVDESAEADPASENEDDDYYNTQFVCT
jgi:hypothetical protein